MGAMHRSSVWLFCFLGYSLGAAAPARNPPAPPEPIDIPIKNVLWQPLPDEVHAVYVGPDDRAWFEVEDPRFADDFATIQKLVEREFKRPMPQLFGTRPILFEPDGRVWFHMGYSSVLAGYDGKEWITYDTRTKYPQFGNAPNHGDVGYHGHNLLVGGVRFF